MRTIQKKLSASRNKSNHCKSKEDMKMRKGMRKHVVVILVVMMVVMNAMPTFAATSKYGEDKPLKTVTKSYYIKKDNGSPHKHWYIDADNGVRYFLYDSCMDGMVGWNNSNQPCVHCND